jgi:hypothetical protein
MGKPVQSEVDVRADLERLQLGPKVAHPLAFLIKPTAPSEILVMLTVYPAVQPTYAVSSSEAREIAPPSWKIGKGAR